MSETSEFSKLTNGGANKLIQLDILCQTSNVLLFMIANMLYKNLVYLTQADIAEKLKMKKSNVNVIIQQMIRVKICLPLSRSVDPMKTYHKGYIINPDIVYKGKPEHLKECYGIFSDAEKKYEEKLAAKNDPPPETRIDSLKLKILDWLRTEPCIKRSGYTAVYADKLREFIAKHGYTDSDLKLLAATGFFLTDKHQLTKPVWVNGKVIRMYCITQNTGSAEVTPSKTEPVHQIFTSVPHSEEIRQLNKLLTQSQKYGAGNTNSENPKLYILYYLKTCAVGEGVVKTTVKEISDTTGISKVTVISFLKWLQRHKFILRPKSGVIVLTKTLMRYELLLVPNSASEFLVPKQPT